MLLYIIIPNFLQTNKNNKNMKRKILTWSMVAALLSAGAVACEEDLDESSVDVTVEVSYPSAWSHVPLSGVSVTVAGKDTLQTDAAGKASVTLKAGSYNFLAENTVHLDTVIDGEPGVLTLVLVGKKDGVNITAADNVVAIALAENDHWFDGDVEPRIPTVLTLKLPERFAADNLGSLLSGLEVTMSGAIDDKLVADANGVINRDLRFGTYTFASAKTATVALTRTYTEQGRLDVSFQGTLSNVAVSTLNKELELTLEVADSTFTAYGDISGPDTVHIFVKGDTLALAGLFAGSLNEGTPRLEYAITAQPQKSETGFGTSEWTTVDSVFTLVDNDLLVAYKGQPAAYDLPAISPTKREVKLAELTVTLYNGSDFVKAKTFPVVQDSVAAELIKIEVVSGSDIANRTIPGTTTFTYATPYASGVTFTKAGYFQGHFSNGTFDDNLADAYTPDYLSRIHHIVIDAENKNGSNAYGLNAEGGSPISAYNATTGVVPGDPLNQFYIARPTAAAGGAAGDEGTFYIYPYGADKNHFAALTLNVKLTSVTGIVQRPNNTYLEGAAARKFRVGQAVAVNSIHYVFLAVAEGPARNYVVNENNGAAMAVIAGSWNSYEGEPIIAGTISSASYRTASVPKPGKTTASTDPDDYAAFGWLILTDKGKTAPVDTPITFKVCPKDRFDANGVPDPAWTLDITTKIYAN
jgi:hypothetical protein